MRRGRLGWMVMGVALVLAVASPALAQEDATPDASLSAIGTEVARQATQIARLTTRVAQVEDEGPGGGAVGTSVARPAAAATATAMPRTPDTASADAEIGDTISVDGIDIVATGTDVLGSFLFTDEEIVPRGSFLVVSLSITNTGDEPFMFPFTDLALRDGEGRKFSLDEDSTNRYNIVTTDVYRTTEMQPGLTYETTALFDVPDDSSGFVLTTAENEVFTIALDR